MDWGLSPIRPPAHREETPEKQPKAGKVPAQVSGLPKTRMEFGIPVVGQKLVE
jgi:hypothetical protein